jgi:sporulation protein YlmC with PRC-barrel domain
MDRERDISTSADGRLVRLHELKDFQVARDDHDIRGWEVRTPDGRKIGKVEELVVDPTERRVRYLDIEVDRKALGVDDDRHVLVPIGAVSLKEDGHDVLIERLPAQGLAGVPPYSGGAITRDYETSLRNYYGATAVTDPGDYYKDDLYNDHRLRRRDVSDMTMSEASAAPRLGDNEVTVPLTGDQEVVVRRPGSNEEIVISKRPGERRT